MRRPCPLPCYTEAGAAVMRGQQRVEDARERAYARASIFFAKTFFEK
jgi:hypothetical protein